MDCRCRPGTPALARLLAAVLWGLLAAAPPPTAAREADSPSTPTLWRALREDGREAFYLMGSVHLGRPSMLDFPPAVDAAWARSEELVLELDLDELAGDAASRAAERHALIASPASLRDRVSEHTLVELARYLERRGDSLEPYLQLEPWYLAILIEAREAARIGLDPSHGVDLHFAGRAAASKPVVGLETTDSQLSILARLPLETQEELLLDALERTRDPRHGAGALVDAWARGDDAELERIFYRPMHEAPELATYYEQLIYGRNETMTQRLASLARDGKLRFVVVGVGHMVGERGIPHLLRDYGFRVHEVEARERTGRISGNDERVEPGEGGGVAEMEGWGEGRDED